MARWRIVVAGLVAAAALTSAPLAAAQSPREVAQAEQAIREISAEDWLVTPSVDLVARVVAASSASALRRAAADGAAEAQALVGSAHENGVSGFAFDQIEAARFYERAAEAGNVLAQYNLGGMYLEGRGVDQDFERALYWRERAAEQGDRMAMSVLGYQYLSGFGVEPDVYLARGYLEQAAGLGDAAAMAMMGIIFEEGIGTDRDLRRAVEWYRQAASLDDPTAQDALRRLGK